MYNRKSTSMRQELKMTLKKLSERQLQIQQCKVQEVQSSVTSLGDETSSGIVSDEEIDKQELEAHYGFMAKIQEVLHVESSSHMIVIGTWKFTDDVLRLLFILG
ncbi:hypothetical protein Tco_1547622 [Tanacetum coccineum]